MYVHCVLSRTIVAAMPNPGCSPSFAIAVSLGSLREAASDLWLRRVMTPTRLNLSTITAWRSR